MSTAVTVVCNRCGKNLATPYWTVRMARDYAATLHWYPALESLQPRKWSEARTATDLCPSCYHMLTLAFDGGRPRADCHVCQTDARREGVEP